MTETIITRGIASILSRHPADRRPRRGNAARQRSSTGSLSLAARRRWPPTAAAPGPLRSPMPRSNGRGRTSLGEPHAGNPADEVLWDEDPRSCDGAQSDLDRLGRPGRRESAV